MLYFPKQFTVGVLNATLDLAALVLVGVVGFLGSEVVLSPVVSLHVGGGCWLVWSASWALKWSCLPLSPGCLPSFGGWVLVGVVGFLGSEVVLSPVVSGCLPSCGGRVLVGVVGFLGCCLGLSPFMWGVGVGWCGRHLRLWSGLVSRCLRLSPVVSGCLPPCGGWVLVGVVGFLGSEVVLSPVVSRLSPFIWGLGVGWCGRLLGLWSGLVSRCLRLSPFMWGAGVGWCGRLLGLWSGLVSRCLGLSPFMWGVGVGWCGRHLRLWSGLVSRCLRLSPVVSGCLPPCGGWVLVGVVGFLGSEVVLSPVVSGCLPSCGGRVLVGVAASRTETFRDQNHRLQSKFAYCKLFGVYAGVIFNTKSSPGSQGEGLRSGGCEMTILSSDYPRIMLGLSSGHAWIVFLLEEALQGVSVQILSFKIYWQAQYLVSFQGDFTCSAHWKWRFICHADQWWDSFCVAGAVFGAVGGWRYLLHA